MPDPSHILHKHRMEVKENLTYEEKPLRTIDKKEQVLRAKVISMVKILWDNHGVEEATLESEELIKTK